MSGYFAPLFINGIELYFQIGMVLLIAAAAWAAIDS